jgi:pyridoxal 5'-phosphate synthase pdxS subunit
MATELPTTNGHDAQDGETNFAVKAGLARMLKGGVIMDVVNAEQVHLSIPQPTSYLPILEKLFGTDADVDRHV